MKIEVWSDFACPFCYIGKTRFENALKKFPHNKEVEVSYKAYLLNPAAPKTMTLPAAEAFAKGHNMDVETAKQRFSMFIENAKTVDLEYNYDIIQMTNTLDAHRVAKWSRKYNKEDEITARFMKAYFTEGFNLADHDTLVSLVQELNLPGDEVKEMLQTSEFEQLVRDEINEGREIGVRGVPFFVLNRKYGVSGAQQEEYFLNALNTLWTETHPLETISEADGPTCNDETCEF